MLNDRNLQEIAEVLDVKFDADCDQRCVRANLVKLGAALRGLQGSLTACNLGDQLDGEVELLYCEGVTQLRIAYLKIKQAAFALDRQ